MNGKIVRMVVDKGFGFLLGDDGIERFFHRSAVAYDSFDAMHEGQAVEFEDEKGPKGPRARQVRLT